MIVGTLVDPERHPLWAGIHALLAKGAARGDGSIWHPWDLVWIAVDGPQIVAALTTCLTKDGAEIINIAGHRAAEWLPIADARISEWAGAAGARKLSARGRKGWGRISAPLGWKAVGQDGKDVLYEKVVR